MKFYLIKFIYVWHNHLKLRWVFFTFSTTKILWPRDLNYLENLSITIDKSVAPNNCGISILLNLFTSVHHYCIEFDTNVYSKNLAGKFIWLAKERQGENFPIKTVKKNVSNTIHAPGKVHSERVKIKLKRIKNIKKSTATTF